MAILKTYQRQVQTSGDAGTGRAIDTGAAQVWDAVGGITKTVAGVVGEFKQRADDANDSVIDSELKNKSAIYSKTRTKLIQDYARSNNPEELDTELGKLDATFDSDYTATIDRYKNGKKKAMARLGYSYMTGEHRTKATEILYSTERAKTTSVEKEVALMGNIAIGKYDVARKDSKTAYEQGLIDDTQYKRVLLASDTAEVTAQESDVQANFVDLPKLSSLKTAEEQIKSEELRAKYPKISDAKWRTFEKQQRRQKNYLEKLKADQQNVNYLNLQAQASQGLLSYIDLDVSERNDSLWDADGDNAGVSQYQQKILRGFMDAQQKAAVPKDIQNDMKTLASDMASDKWFRGGKFETEKELQKFVKDIANNGALSPNTKFYVTQNATKTYNLKARDPNNGEYFSSRLAELIQIEARLSQYDPERDPSKEIGRFLDSLGDNIAPENVDKYYEARKTALQGQLKQAVTDEILKRNAKSASLEVEKKLKDGRTAIFNPETKEFIRFK